MCICFEGMRNQNSDPQGLCKCWVGVVDHLQWHCLGDGGRNIWIELDR